MLVRSELGGGRHRKAAGCRQTNVAGLDTGKTSKPAPKGRSVDSKIASRHCEGHLRRHRPDYLAALDGLLCLLWTSAI